MMMCAIEFETEKVWFDEDNLWVMLSGGRTIGAPLAWFTRLLHADISVHGLLLGQVDQRFLK